MNKPHISVEALIKPHWSAQDREKVEAVIAFVQLIMNDHNFDEVTKQYGQNSYRQHNRTIADNIEGVVRAVSDLVKTAPEFSYDVKHAFVDGDYVIIHSHATLKSKHRGDDAQGFNIIDTWRLENGKLVEHWDAVQGLSFSMRLYSLMVGGKVRNSNGVF